MGDVGRPADPAHQEDVLQQSDEDGDRVVRLHLRRGAQHPHVRVSVAMAARFLSRGVFWCTCVTMVESSLQRHQQDQRRHRGPSRHFPAALHHLRVRLLHRLREGVEVDAGHRRGESPDRRRSRAHGCGEAGLLFTSLRLTRLVDSTCLLPPVRGEANGDGAAGLRQSRRRGRRGPLLHPDRGGFRWRDQRSAKVKSARWKLDLHFLV